MRSRVEKRRRPSTKKELEFGAGKKITGGEYLNGVIEKISLESVSLEERRKEAKKPLYLVRYE